LLVSRVGVTDSLSGRGAAASLVSGYLSDAARFREIASTVGVRVFDLPGAPGLAWVVDRLRRVSDDRSVLRALAAPTAAGIDPRREAVAVASEARGFELPAGSRPSHAEVVRAEGGRLEVRAEGPGLLVIAESFDRGWRAAVDERPVPVLRVNHMAMALALPAGVHRVELTHHPRGLGAGVALLGVGALLLAVETSRWRAV
jgi:hypothetical protein